MISTLSTESIWYAPGADRLVAVSLDSLTTLYDRASGQTHLLATPAAEILALLADAPVTLDRLVDRLAERFDLKGEGDPRTLVAARLEELAALGLVEAHAA